MMLSTFFLQLFTLAGQDLMQMQIQPPKKIQKQKQVVTDFKRPPYKIYFGSAIYR